MRVQRTPTKQLTKDSIDDCLHEGLAAGARFRQLEADRSAPARPGGGLRKQLSRTQYGTKRESQRALAALVAKVSEGKFTSTAKTLGQLLDSWLEHVEGSLSPTTVLEYRRLTERPIKPGLGRLRLRVTTQVALAGDQPAGDH